MKLLIAGPDTFADVICSTLLVRCLKQQLPEPVIFYQIKESFADVLQANAYIDVLETKTSALHHASDVDGIIDLTASKEWRSVAAKKDISYLSTDNSLLQKLGIFINPQQHRAVQYLSAAASLLVNDDGRGLDYFIPQHAHVAAHDIPAAHSAGYIALLVDEAFLNDAALHLLQLFCKDLNHPIILLGDKNAAPIAAHLSDIDPVKIYSACGKFTRNETADLVLRSRLLITPELAWLQVAAALKKPVIALRNTGKSSPYLPPFYEQYFIRQQVQTPYSIIRINNAQKHSAAQAAQFAQAVQQHLSIKP